MLVLKNKRLVDDKTGEIFCENIAPKFQGWEYSKYKKVFDTNKMIRFLEPMKAEELEGEALDAILYDEHTVAEKKWDGHRAEMFLTPLGNRLFSRNISKETGWFSENSDNMPHIRDLQVDTEFLGTVLDGEITLPVENCTHRDVQGVTGSLPDTALNNQLERGFAVLNAFDILYYKGINIQKLPYWKRKVYLLRAIKELSSEYVKFCKIYVTTKAKQKLSIEWMKYLDSTEEYYELVNYLEVVDDYQKLFRRMIEIGDEGLILKGINTVYEQKRSKSFAKMKAHKTYDVVIMGYEDPSHFYEGEATKDPTLTHDWWEDAEDDGYFLNKPMTCEEGEGEGMFPVTKFYAKGWIGALKFGVWIERHLQYFLDMYKGDLIKAKKHIAIGKAVGTIREDGKYHRELIQVGRCSGLDDDLRKKISENKDEYLGTVIEVEAQGIINNETGSLQHPRFVMFRPDKDSEECTFEDHIRRYGEDKKNEKSKRDNSRTKKKRA